ncbi:MAG: GatB/YqeY domain-containing protein [Candidatus Omnitrophica bacterium]|nr:GatB/YqeY domain-containing protein [Candidatus Omnitrophota bacterium]
MTLTERIEADYKTAYKAGQRVRIDTLRMVKAGIERAASDQRKERLEDADVVRVLAQQAKQRKETLEAAKASGRQDVLAQATEELQIINGYLPQALGPEAVKPLIEEALKAVGPNQGQIMKYVMSKAKGAVDGKLVSQLVGERLAQAKAA